MQRFSCCCRMSWELRAVLGRRRGWKHGVRLLPVGNWPGARIHCLPGACLTARTEHQTPVLCLPLADVALVPRVPAARCHPHLGLPLCRRQALRFPPARLLCHVDVSTDTAFLFFSSMHPGVFCRHVLGHLVERLQVLKFLCKESKIAGIISIFQTHPGSVAGRRLHSEHEAATGKN